MSETLNIGRQIADLCRQGKFEEATEKYYSSDIVSIEPMGGLNMPARIEGIDAIRKKGEWWVANHEVHGVEVDGPWPHGDRFILRFKMDVTAKDGPMAGKRMNMDETGLYTVKNGKIAQEEFFYSMGE